MEYSKILTKHLIPTKMKSIFKFILDHTILKLVLFLFVAVNTVSVMASDTRLIKGNAYYEEGNFKDAIAAYEDILKTGLESPGLYYNLGNAYYRNGLLTKAIINYERALLLAPHDRDIRYNLDLAYSQITDKIAPVGTFFLAKWLSQLRSYSNSDTWAIVSIVSFAVCLLMLFFFFFAKTILVKKVSFYLVVLSVLLSAITFGFSSNQKSKLINRDRAIIMTPSVIVRSSPDSSGTEIFVLHEGTRVSILETVNDWHKIEPEDGNIGWIPINALEII